MERDVAAVPGRLNLAPAAARLWQPVGAAAFCTGMVALAMAVHSEDLPGVLTAGGLLATCGVACMLLAAPDPLRLTGLRRGQPRVAASAVTEATLLLGTLAVLLAGMYRLSLDLSLLPVRLGRWTAILVMIGIAEELGWRGLVQGSLARPGPAAAVVLAALAHAAYKTVLLATSAAPATIPLGWLAASTVGFGLLLGQARQHTGSVLPAVVSHALFDLAAYGDAQALPWWVR
jgi:membrane protease YdiL (CAAX protease family)